MVKLKGLGRGLDALLSVADTAEDRLQTLAIDLIRPGKYQPRSRMNEAALNELADSIRAQGVIQPVVVREIGFGEYELIAGERRWRAARIAGLGELPAVIKTVPDEAALAMALIENIQRQELDAIEEAQGIQRLINEFGMSHESAAEALGRSRSAVSNLLRLLALPEAIQSMLHDGLLEMGHARALLPLPAPRQLKLAEEAAKHGWSVREVERRVQQDGRPAPVRPQQDPDIRRLADTLAEHLGAGVAIRHGKAGKGKITIEYSSVAALEGILEKLQVKSME
ncbi:MAG: ParB/RepB/Spo0J family partition protein [Paludibacterium sp.]|uniref:ParB/RepB/Spo0J family partition protein n=1 Tax=Paludibacterium sp. TaxID=1917523 RepID=UPI0025F3A718|nr:ParB/RepB/Spo0J family partition protein [Paludibacterium sp.]MBV8047792.1 ParB/RepB/Spo0J family partition protein [Paludibacterium sp.]MBV8647375.1 ParB/RepB/Spo0J family partition protein [Paludibacterium sp.]